jgi:hypothetical protein
MLVSALRRKLGLVANRAAQLNVLGTHDPLNSLVMPGLVPGIHEFSTEESEDVDGRAFARRSDDW